MIGPHEGKELELMLSGKKPMAAFGDVIPENGVIPEEIIPEKAFAPYVQNGDFYYLKSEVTDTDNDIIRYVCFTLPGEEWRAKAYIWLRTSIHHRVIPCDRACDIMIGRLLGYNEKDIAEFISRS